MLVETRISVEDLINLDSLGSMADRVKYDLTHDRYAVFESSDRRERCEALILDVPRLHNITKFYPCNAR